MDGAILPDQRTDAAAERRLASERAVALSPRWLTAERARAYATIIGGALLLAVFLLVATSHAGLDRWGRPLGTDFAGVWVAGGEVCAGHSAMPYDNAAHAAAQAAAFGASDSFLPWPYPPVFLLVAAALATLPYLAALALWQAGTLGLYLVAMHRCLARAGLSRRDMLLAALAFPAVAINLLHGQNGFLSAGLLALGTLLLGRRPASGGALLGLLIYKPQLALAVPVALLAGRHWRALGGAALGAAATSALSLAVFGPEPWRAFVADLGFARRVILEMGGLESFKLQSAFAAARLLGASVSLAYGAQTVVAIAALGGVAWLWHGDHDCRLQLAGLAVASLLATPYAMDYDMVVLAPALAAVFAVVLERRSPGGAPRWAMPVLAGVWLVPLVARTCARALLLPIGILSMGALLLLVIGLAAGAPGRIIQRS